MGHRAIHNPSAIILLRFIAAGVKFFSISSFEADPREITRLSRGLSVLQETLRVSISKLRRLALLRRTCSGFPYTSYKLASRLGSEAQLANGQYPTWRWKTP
jgi:hypothetical protein